MVIFIMFQMEDAGEGAKELVETAFGEPQENWVHVPGLVSRKKQFVPSVLHVLQQ